MVQLGGVFGAAFQYAGSFKVLENLVVGVLGGFATVGGVHGVPIDGPGTEAGAEPCAEALGVPGDGCPVVGPLGAVRFGVDGVHDV